MKKNKVIMTLCLFFGLLFTAVGCSSDGTDSDSSSSTDSSSSSSTVEVIKLDTPTQIIYDKHTIKWETVNNAESYVVKINDEEISSSSNHYDYETTTDFTLQIKAVVDKENYESSDYSELIDFKFLTVPQNLKIENGIITWDEVPNASKYEILDEENNSYFVDSNYFDGLSDSKDHIIKVKAVGDDITTFTSDYSEELDFIKLAKPTDLVFDLASKSISWNPVTGASSYILNTYVNDEIINSIEVSQYSTGIPFTIEEDNKYKIAVQALSIEDGVSSSSLSDPIYIEVLKTIDVSTIKISEQDDGSIELTFSPVDNAKSYMLYINGEEVGPITTTQNISLTEKKNVVSIKTLAFESAIDDTYYLNSKVVDYSIYKLDQVTDLSVVDNNLIWPEIEGANSYEVSIDGNIIETMTNLKQLSTLTTGTFEVKVRAKGNGSSNLSGNFSESISIEKLPTILKTDFKKKGSLLSWTPVFGCKSYTVSINDDVINTSLNYIDLNDFKVDSIKIRVKSVGNYAENKLDSDLSQLIIINRLNTPKNIRYNSNGILTWDEVPNATSYQLRINEENHEISGTRYDLSLIVGNGDSFLCTIKAKTEKFDFLDSETSGITQGHRLTVPTNVKIEDDKFIWDPVDGAEGYLVNIDGFTTVVKDCFYKPGLKTATSGRRMKVKAIVVIDETTPIINSFNSSYTDDLVFDTTVLGCPTNVKSERRVNEDGTIDLVISYSHVQGSLGYVVYVNGVENITFENQFVYRVPKPVGVYSVSVKTLGNGLTSIDSIKSTENIYDFLQQPVLEYSKEGKDKYSLNWNSIPDCLQYELKIEVFDKNTNQKNEELSKIEKVSSNKIYYSINTDTTNYYYHISIKTVGDNVNSFDSEFSNVVKIGY